MSPPGRTERGRNREIIQGRITAYQHARCNMSTRSFIPWGAVRFSGRQRYQSGQVR